MPVRYSQARVISARRLRSKALLSMSRAATNAAQVGCEARWADCGIISTEKPDILGGPHPARGASLAIVRACYTAVPSSADDCDVPIAPADGDVRNSQHATVFGFVLSPCRAPGDAPLGRLLKERRRNRVKKCSKVQGLQPGIRLHQKSTKESQALFRCGPRLR